MRKAEVHSGQSDRKAGAWGQCLVMRPTKVAATALFLLVVMAGRSPVVTEISPWNMGDGFRHIYLDLGTNIGVQIRKLYEPELYPNAGVHEFFDEWFEKVGDRKNTVCAYGFEPDPSHSQRLKEIEAVYRSRGFCVRIFTQTAIGTRDTMVTLYQDKDIKHQRWSSSVVMSRNMDLSSRSSYNVNSINASRLVESVSERCCWDDTFPTRKKPAIVMKMDIEGAEYEVIPQLIKTGMICRIDLIFVEWHIQHKNFPSSLQAKARRKQEQLYRAVKMCPRPPVISDYDDESYLSDGQPLRHQLKK